MNRRYAEDEILFSCRWLLILLDALHKALYLHSPSFCALNSLPTKIGFTVNTSANKKATHTHKTVLISHIFGHHSTLFNYPCPAILRPSAKAHAATK